MILALFFAVNAFSLNQEEMDNAMLTPAFLSDFVNARQIRNLTISAQNEMASINGQYFIKPVFDLLSTLQPTYLVLNQLSFHSFDGKIINGESHGLAKFADLHVYDCEFKNGFSTVATIKGPEKESFGSSNDDNAII